MCIIIDCPIDTKFPSREILNHCWEQNPHGGGVMYVNKGRIEIFKSLDKDEFLDYIEAAHELFNTDSPIVVHMRWATKGSKTIDNVHPFMVTSKYAFCHNGTINHNFVNCTKDESDSKQLGVNLFSKLPYNWYRNSTYNYLMENYLRSSKVVILSHRGKTYRYNEGIEEGGVWFSNDYFKLDKKRAQYPNTDQWGEYQNWGDAARNYIAPADAKYIVSTESVKWLYITTPKVPTWTGGFHCEVCGMKKEWEDLQVLMFKQINGHSIRMEVCDECHSMMSFHNNLPMLATDPSCSCGHCARKIGNPYSKQKYNLCFTLNERFEQIRAEVLCSACGYDYFRKDIKSYSGGDAAWIIDSTTGKFKPEALEIHIKPRWSLASK